MSRRRVAAAAVAGAAIALVALVGHARTSARKAGSRGASLLSEASRLPRPEHPAFTVRRPRLLDRHEASARFAPVLRTALARVAPSPAAPVVVSLDPETTEGTTNIVLVTGERRRGGELWLHIRLPVLPNGRTAWVPRRAVGGYQFVHTHLVVDRTRLVATLYRNGRRVFTAPVGVGTSSSPTPSGEFYVRDRVSGFGNPFYGPVAFGTSARSAVLTDWPAGGFVGIHGTNEPGLIPGRVSHGCIRLRNADILRLRRLMPVGTPLSIR